MKQLRCTLQSGIEMGEFLYLSFDSDHLLIIQYIVIGIIHCVKFS
jgi:hypothetical protein